MRSRVAVATILNALASIGPQLLGLLLLDSFGFGKFSVTYLVFGLASALVLSVLCDTWTIGRPSSGSSTWVEYSSVLVIFSLAFGSIAFLISLVSTGDIVFAALSWVALSIAVYRVGVRYFLIYFHKWNTAIVVDAIFLASILTSIFLTYSILAPIHSIVLSWAIASFCSLAPTYLPRVKLRLAYDWSRRNRKVILPFLGDTLVLESSSIGTPYILLPFLGLSGFGIYRAVSNFSSPVRLLVAPFRPFLMRHPRWPTRGRNLALVMFVGVLAGLGAVILLEALGGMDNEISVLVELSSYSIPTGAYVSGAMLLSIYPTVCRASGRVKPLALGRGSQTLLGILLPVGGFVLLGLDGAIWLFSVSTLISGVVWLLLALSLNDRPEIEGSEKSSK